MAARRKTKAHEAQLAFEALSIEGGLLSPAWLSKVAQLQAGTQAEPDYRIPKGLNLRDEIGRYWRIAQAHWADFKTGREAKADPKATAERFILSLLRDSFGFAALTPVEPAVLQERSYPIGHATLGGRVPVVVAPADTGLDTLSPVFGDGARRRSAFGLAQEYLNAQEGALWGITSNGVNLRIVRDNASLTRPAWIEVDIERIFIEDRYADFAALWLLCHETRFGREGQPVTECALEAWRDAGREEGTRAREHLRRGVEEALIALGQGFLSHADNAKLRADLQNGTLPLKDYFNQLLRLVYRLIFLLTVEERGFLHPDGVSDATKSLYASGYGIRRLRERSAKRSAHDRFSDLWEATTVVTRGLASGEPRLGLPALAGIFAANQCPALDSAKLENRALLLAMFKLAWLREDGSLARVNWRDMGPEELGSVYESLLELVPQIGKDGREFGFATGGETKGNARKTTGSYYTPSSLVQVLLDSALEPVITDTIAKNPSDSVNALLGLAIVDPACGSGHFLLAAARRLAGHVARLQANGTPSGNEYRHALRQVVGHCIFGVDLNPMAVELCKVGLWMEAVEPGLPLTFLNSHIQHGNALLGTTPELMAKGIPDAAWDAIEGDDKKAASALKKRNKSGATGQRSLDTLWSKPVDAEAQTVTHAIAELDTASDANAEALAKKEERWGGILGSPAYRHQKFVADAWCAAFVWPKQSGELTDAAPTNELWRQLRDGQGKAPALTTKTVGELADQYRFFHWHLQFPQVFAKGGFDVVLGNPPWERVKLQEQEFFASRHEAIAKAENGARRKKLIAALERTSPELWHEWACASRTAEGESQFVRQAARFPLCGTGDVNTYALFAEHNRFVLHPFGCLGMIVPSGIATEATTRTYFDTLMIDRSLSSFWEFENEGFFTAGKGHMLRFGLLTVEGAKRPKRAADFFFQGQSITELSDPERHFSLTRDEIFHINPNTRTCPIFKTRRDASIAKEVHSRVPILLNESNSAEVRDGEWGVALWSMFHMTSDAGIFRTAKDLVSEEATRNGTEWATKAGERLVPLVEAKTIYIATHRHGDFAGQDGERSHRLPEVPQAQLEMPHFAVTPYWWVPENAVTERMVARSKREWLLVWRDVTDARASIRTVISAIIPRYGVGNSLSLLDCGAAIDGVVLFGALSTFVVDFMARQRIAGLHLNFVQMKQLPLVRRTVTDAYYIWADGVFVDWLRPRVLELVYNAWDLEPFARDLDYLGPPFRWNPDRRFQLRCELDAAFFHLYGLARDDVDYIMDTFPIVRKNDEKAHGEYRTKRVILEIYDAFAKAAYTGKPYSTPLDPPPAAPGASHGVFAADGTPKDYAEALRLGLLFMLIHRSGNAGISYGSLSRALLWLEDAKHAATGLQGASLTDFEQVHASDPLLAQGASDASKLLQALENEKVITRDSKGIVRLRAGSTIPNWLPQTPTLAKLASVMRAGLEQAEAGASTAPAFEKTPTWKAKPA
jgi:hypothetical protein